MERVLQVLVLSEVLVLPGCLVSLCYLCIFPVQADQSSLYHPSSLFKDFWVVLDLQWHCNTILTKHRKKTNQYFFKIQSTELRFDLLWSYIPREHSISLVMEFMVLIVLARACKANLFIEKYCCTLVCFHTKSILLSYFRLMCVYAHVITCVNDCAGVHIWTFT